MRRSILVLLPALCCSGAVTGLGQPAFGQAVQLVTPAPLSTAVRVSTTQPRTLEESSFGDPAAAERERVASADPESTSEDLMGDSRQPDNHLFRVTDVEPLPVVLSDGRDAGRVSAALMNDQGDVKYVSITFRHRDYFVPYAVLQASAIAGLLQLNATPQQFQEAPKYFAHRWPDINSPEFGEIAAADFPGVTVASGDVGNPDPTAPVSALVATTIPQEGVAAAPSGNFTGSAIPQPLIDSPFATTAAGVPSLALPLGTGVVRTREAGVDVTAVPTAPMQGRQQAVAKPPMPTSAMFPQPGNTAPENSGSNVMVAPLLFGAGRAPRAFTPSPVNSPAMNGGTYAPNWVGNSVPSVIYPNTTVIQNGGAITGVNAATRMQSGVSRGNTFIPSAVFSGQGVNSNPGLGVGPGRGMGQSVAPANQYPASVIRPTYVGPGANSAYNTAGGVNNRGGVGATGGAGMNNGGVQAGSPPSPGATRSTPGPATRP